MEIIKIKSKEHWLGLRTQDLTSTDISALFDMSPYLTAFELWHRKKDQVIPEIEQNERMQWGNRLEDAIALGIAEDHNLTVSPMKDYYRDPEFRIGSSFDYSIDAEDPGILEIKNVDGLVFKNKWVTNENDELIEAPAHIEMQLQHQMAISGREYVYLGALVGGNKTYVMKRKIEPTIVEQIKKKSLEFWASIDEGKVPEVDWTKDSEFVSSLYKHSEPGTIIDANEAVYQLAGAYKQVSDKIKELNTKKGEYKAKILQQIGQAEKAMGPNFTVSAGFRPETEVKAFTKKEGRNFRITWRK